jgi:hypothetical protein
MEKETQPPADVMPVLTADDFRERISRLIAAREEKKKTINRFVKRLGVPFAVLLLIIAVVILISDLSCNVIKYYWKYLFVAFTAGYFVIVLQKPSLLRGIGMLIFSAVCIIMCAAGIVIAVFAEDNLSIDKGAGALIFAYAVLMVTSTIAYAAARAKREFPSSNIAVWVGVMAALLSAYPFLLVLCHLPYSFFVQMHEFQYASQLYMLAIIAAAIHLFIIGLHLWPFAAIAARSRERAQFYARTATRLGHWILAAFMIALLYHIVTVAMLCIVNWTFSGTFFLLGIINLVFLLPVAIGVAGFFDFLTCLAFRKWSKNVDIEIYRMKQELGEDETGMQI